MAVFAVAIVWAAACYPGHDAAVGHYRFGYDFISALGVTRTPGGLDNHPACTIFNVALGGAMLLLLPYWMVRVRCVRGPRALRLLAFLCCAGFSLGVFGVSLTPYDLRPHLHNACIYSAFALIVPGILTLLVASDPALAGPRYKWAWAAFAVGLLLCEWRLVTLVGRHVLPSRPVNPLIQKANVGVFFGWMLLDVWLFDRYLDRKREGARHAGCSR